MNMEKQVIHILRAVDAIMTDNHFVYTSGKHGSVFVRKDRLYPHSQLTAKVCKMIAQDVQNLLIDVVVGPSLCGIVLSQWVSYHLSKIVGKEIMSVFTEKPSDPKELFNTPQVFKRGYELLVQGKNVLVVEDVTTTGASVKKVVDLVRAAGGNIVMVYVIVNRNPDGVHEEMMGSPFRSLAVVKADAYDEKDCPLCKKNIPVNTEVGHGKEYMAKKTQQIYI